MNRNRIFLTILFIISIFLLSNGNVMARKYKGVNFPETEMISGKTCKLNGLGVRKEGYLISVYIGALYLEKPKKNEVEVIISDQTKRVVMHFILMLLEVDGKKLQETWIEGFKKNAPGAQTRLKDEIARFLGFFTGSVKNGDAIVITYIPGKGTEVKIKNEVKGVIEGADFMRALFAIWFGKHPPTESLKEGLLGK